MSNTTNKVYLELAEGMWKLRIKELNQDLKGTLVTNLNSWMSKCTEYFEFLWKIEYFIFKILNIY